MQTTFKCFAISLVVFAAHYAHSADISFTESGVLVEGVIEPGDFKKFEKLAREHPVDPGQVVLWSTGGNVLEAMDIGRLVRKLKWHTLAPPDITESTRISVGKFYGVRNPSTNGVCASACMYIYVAGIRRGGGRVGIHRPSFPVSSVSGAAPEQAMEAASQVRDIVSEFLIEMGVSQTVIDRMFQIPKEEVEILDRAEHEKYFPWHVAGLDDWLESQCGKEPSRKLSDAEWSVQNDRWSDCMRNAPREMRVKAAAEVFQKRS